MTTLPTVSIYIHNHSLIGTDIVLLAMVEFMEKVTTLGTTSILVILSLLWFTHLRILDNFNYSLSGSGIFSVIML